jgi:hypothetical protein
VLIAAIVTLCSCKQSTSPTTDPSTGTASVTLGAQSGTITAGAAGSVTFAATTTNVTAGTVGTVTWYTSSAGTTTTTAPTGITPSVSAVGSNAATVTLTASSSAVGGSYYFTVTEGSATTDVATFIVSNPLAKPGAPSGLSATPGNSHVSLSWTAVSGATGYNVYRSTVSGTQGSKISSPASGNYIDTSATNGTTYYYEVTAQNAGGESSVSTQQSALPNLSFMTNYTTGNGLGSNTVFGVAISESNIGAATSNGLSMSFNGGIDWTNYTTSNSLGSNTVYGVAVEAYMLSGVEISLVICAATNGGSSESLSNGPSDIAFVPKGNNTAYGVAFSGSTFYAATSNGLTVVPSGSLGTTYTTTNGLGSNNVRGVAISGSTLYAATINGLSVSTNGGSSWTNYTTTNGLGSNYVCGVTVSGSTIYAGTNGGVSVSANGGSSWTNYTTTNGLGSNYVYGVAVSGSTIYAATSNGLSVSTTGGSSWTNYTTTNGLGSNQVYGVAVSGLTVYAATGNGLSVAQ